MTAREKAVAYALDQLGKDVLMGYRGDIRFDRATKTYLPTGLDFLVFDCSGHYGASMEAGGLANMRKTHNAQMYHDESRELLPMEAPLPGDPVLYGLDEKRIEHITMYLAGGHCISADGATWGITTLEQARASRCQVRIHNTIHYRTDLPYRRVRRFTALDAVDSISR